LPAGMIVSAINTLPCGVIALRQLRKIVVAR